MCASNEALDLASNASIDTATGLSGSLLVRQEAILNCLDKKWSSFLCIPSLASVRNREISCYSLDNGSFFSSGICLQFFLANF